MRRFISNRYVLSTLCLVIAFILGFLLSYQLFFKESKIASGFMKTETVKGTSEENKEIYRLVTMYMQIMNMVDENYYKEVNRTDMIKASINGMLQSLDQHSSFLSESDYSGFSEHTSGEFGGLGLQVSQDDSGFIKVISAIDGTPAFKAGILNNDYITAIDGEQIVGLPLDVAVKKLKGKPGTKVTITIIRGRQTSFDVTLTRELIRTAPVKIEIKDGNILYIRLPEFDEKTYSEMIKGIKDNKSKTKGLILDLRSNPGGLLDQAVKISNTFLKEGEIVSVRPRKLDLIQRYSADGTGLFTDVPMIILINGGSASASEIVAGALKDQSRATLIGTKSFGKGSVQTVVRLSDKDEALRLTIALYYTPSGNTINKVGIEPDVYVSVLGTTCLKEKCSDTEKRKINDEYIPYDSIKSGERPKDLQLEYAVNTMKKTIEQESAK